MPGPPGPPGRTGVHFYALQTARTDYGVVGAWADVPGASVMFSTVGSAEVRMQANGSIAGLGGTTPWIRCVFRFLIDGSPASDSNPNFGDLVMSPGKLEAGVGEWTPYFVSRLALVGAGGHTVKLQLAHGYTMNTTTDGTCSTDEFSYSRARLEVWVEEAP